MTVVAGFFPSTSLVHVFHAAQSGIFARAGIEVDLRPVASAHEQLALWDDGTLTVMHTSPDHLFGPRARRPVAVRREGIGELALYTRGAEALTAGTRYGVDDPGSAFALVLRAVLDGLGVEWSEESFVPIGGTRERWAALGEGRIDGTLLHTPFDLLAEREGFARRGGHLDVVPDLATAVVAAAGDDAGSDGIRVYVEALDRSERELLAGGTELVARVLGTAGFAPDIVALAAGRVRSELAARTADGLREGVEAAAALRSRYRPSWIPDRSLDDLLG